MRELEGLPPEILLIPLTGHTRGHACVAVKTGEGAVVHAGDAYFHHAAVTEGEIPFGLRVFESNIAIDPRKIRSNHARLRQLRGERGIHLFCAHDPTELPAATGSLSGVPSP